jgi:hypothetical protein
MINTIMVSDIKETVLIFETEDLEIAEEIIADMKHASLPFRWIVIGKKTNVTIVAGQPLYKDTEVIQPSDIKVD